MKCPLSQRETLNIDEAVTNTDIFIYAKKNVIKDHKYYAQVQYQLFVCNFEKCDFVVGHQCGYTLQKLREMFSL